MQRYRCAGFSLVELIIAIAVLSIIAAVAGINLHSYTMNRNLKSAAEDIASDISLCKERAISDSGTTYAITFDKGNNKYTITGTDSTSGAVKMTQVKSPSGLDRQGIVLDNIALTGGGMVITCQARGTLNPASGNIRLKNSRGTTITTYYSATGRTYVK